MGGVSCWGSSRCAGLLDRGREESISGGAPTARGCSREGGRKLFLRELPLRVAAGLREGGVYFWGSSLCAGLLDCGRGEAVSRGSSRCAGLLDRGREEAVLGGGAKADSNAA